MTPPATEQKELGTLTVTAVATTGGQTITVSPEATAGNSLRYQITPSTSKPTVNYNTTCAVSDHWVNFTSGSKVTGATGNIITVVEVDSLDKAVKKGEATLPAPTSE